MQRRWTPTRQPTSGPGGFATPVAVALAVALLTAVPDSAVAGSLGVPVDGGTEVGHGPNLTVIIPAPYRVWDWEQAGRRLLVTVSAPADSVNGRSALRTEVWQFPLAWPKRKGDPSPPPPSLDDRKTLVSFTSSFGERERYCRRTISCRDATAVFVEGWENGFTLVFDAAGEPLDLVWPRPSSPEHGTKFEFITPIAWIGGSSPGGHDCLVLRANDLGDLHPSLLVYDAQTHTFTQGSMDSLLTPMGAELVNALMFRAQRP